MNTNRVLWVDFIRVVAVIFVVWLHSASPLLYRYNDLPPFYWWTGNILESLVITCVPLFFMLTGTLLLGKQETMKAYILKRVSKVLIPLVAWSIFYYLWRHYFSGSGEITLSGFFKMFLTSTYYHLWFLYALLGLYLYIPILRILVQNSSREYLYYFVALWFVAVSVIPFIEKASHTASLIDLKMISGYVGYLVLGHLLGSVVDNKRWFILSAWIALGCAIITMAGTAFLTIRNNGVFVDYFYAYLSPNVIIFAISTFIVLKYVSSSVVISPGQGTILQKISSASFGIYLVHPIVLDILNRAGLNASSFNPLISLPVMATLTFGLSLAITLLLRQVPFLQKIVP